MILLLGGKVGHRQSFQKVVSVWGGFFFGAVGAVGAVGAMGVVGAMGRSAFDQVLFAFQK